MTTLIDMPSSYRIASAYVRLIVQADNAVLKTIGPILAKELEIALQQEHLEGELVNRIFEALAKQGHTSWISTYGSQIGVGSHGPVGFAALSAPNLRTSLEVFAEYAEIRASATSALLRERGGQLEYVLKDSTGHEFAGRWLIESTLLAAQYLIETVMGHKLGTPSKVGFSCRRRTWHKEIEAVFHTQCLYQQPDNFLSIPLSWANMPSPLYEPDSFRANLAKAREVKLSLDSNKHDVLHLVTTRLLNHFDRRLNNSAKHSNIPSQQVLAAELGLSPRTLIRRLADQDASYKEILQSIRYQRAQTLLTTSHDTAAEIAQKLGYLEPANFGRAFKRWSGHSPASWRRNLNAE